jgi:DNA polymerase-3 subunit epsilon
VTAENEALAAALEATGDYRVLRRLKRRSVFNDAGMAETKLGIVLDLETTGMNAATEEIIEMAMLPFTFTADGEICEVREPFHRLRQPRVTIPPEITKITGLDDAAVRGHVIDPAEVEAFAAPAVVIIAHNAAFDRPFAERFCKVFASKAWACSSEQVDWAAEGFEGKKLGYLAMAAGFFYERHKAVEDCAAVLELLARPLRSGVPALAALLEVAREPTNRIWAISSPFETKDTLKARGYRWNDGTDDRPKSWFTDVSEEARHAEIAWLHKEIYKREATLRVERITAFSRFSERA